jgi:hypothetical protein
MENIETKTFSEIAQFIATDWKKRQPLHDHYLRHLQSLHFTKTINENGRHNMYGADTAQAVVLYFLCNASTYRGPNAKMVKNELKKRLRDGGYFIK